MKTSETLLLKPFRRSPSTTFKNLLHYRVEFKIEVQKLIYSFKGDTEINDHFAAPIQLQMLGEKLWNTSLSYKRTY